MNNFDQQSKEIESEDKRGSRFSKKLLKATSFKKVVGKTKSLRLSKESKSKHSFSSSGDQMIKSSDDDEINIKKKERFDSSPLENGTDEQLPANSGADKTEKEESRKIINDKDKATQKRRRDVVKSRRESTREKSTGNEGRKQKRDAYRKATSSKNLTDNSPKQKKRASHIGQGRRRGVSVSRNKTALSLSKAQLDRINVDSDLDEPGQDKKTIVENIRKRSATRKTNSVRDMGAARSVTRSHSGIDDTRKSFTRTASGIEEENRKPLRRTKSGVVANRRPVGRTNSGIEEGRRPLRRTQSSTQTSRRRSLSRNRRSSSRNRRRPSERRISGRDRQEDEEDLNKSRRKVRGGNCYSRKERTAMADDSKGDEIGNSRESTGGGVNRGKRRLRRKDSGDGPARSMERNPDGSSREKRRGGKNQRSRESSKRRDSEGSLGDLDASINSLGDSDASKEETFPMETNPKERRSLLRRSTSANQMVDPAVVKATELAPADQVFNSRVGGSSSMRVERTTFASSFPAEKQLTIDDFTRTLHSAKRGSGKDRPSGFIKSLGGKLGTNKAGTISKGARNLIIAGIGGGNRTEKRGLLDFDDDSVLS